MTVPNCYRAAPFAPPARPLRGGAPRSHPTAQACAVGAPRCCGSQRALGGLL